MKERPRYRVEHPLMSGLQAYLNRATEGGYEVVSVSAVDSTSPLATLVLRDARERVSSGRSDAAAAYEAAVEYLLVVEEKYEVARRRMLANHGAGDNALRDTRRLVAKARTEELAARSGYLDEVDLGELGGPGLPPGGEEK